MLFKSITASALLLALSTSVNAGDGKGVVMMPALGNSDPGANDVQHPSQNAPCGDISIASNLAGSTPVEAATDGTFKVQIKNFNA